MKLMKTKFLSAIMVRHRVLFLSMGWWLCVSLCHGEYIHDIIDWDDYRPASPLRNEEDSQVVSPVILSDEPATQDMATRLPDTEQPAADKGSDVFLIGGWDAALWQQVAQDESDAGRDTTSGWYLHYLGVMARQHDTFSFDPAVQLSNEQLIVPETESNDP